MSTMHLVRSQITACVWSLPRALEESKNLLKLCLRASGSAQRTPAASAEDIPGVSRGPERIRAGVAGAGVVREAAGVAVVAGSSQEELADFRHCRCVVLSVSSLSSR